MGITSNIIVEVEDINDNPSQFESLPQGSISVSEGIRPSSILFIVSATDDDATSTVITPNG